MKYKLINITTKKETICDKVTIDGFDYYINNEEIKENDWLIALDIIESWGFKSIAKADKDQLDGIKEGYAAAKIIATNNSNIDIPKVVDEVEKLASEFAFCYPGSQSEEEYDSKLMGYYYGYNKSKETHPFSEEDMVEFLEWKDKLQLNNEIGLMDRGFSVCMFKNSDVKTLTTKELLQIWKEQRPKTLYYE